MCETFARLCTIFSCFVNLFCPFGITPIATRVQVKAMSEIVQTTMIPVIQELKCEVCCIDGGIIIPPKVMNALRGTLSELHQSRKCRSEKTCAILVHLVPQFLQVGTGWGAQDS